MRAIQRTGSSTSGQGALEYLLLIGGAVVVAVIVIFLLIGIAGSTGNAANTTVQTGFQHIQDALGDGATGFCGDGTCAAGETETDCSADCGCNNNTICESKRGENLYTCIDC